MGRSTQSGRIASSCLLFVSSFGKEVLQEEVRSIMWPKSLRTFEIMKGTTIKYIHITTLKKRNERKGKTKNRGKKKREDKEGRKGRKREVEVL